MIQIITGSTLGGTEYVGDHIKDLLDAQGFESQIHNQPLLSEIALQGIWLVITSTHGAGEYPDNIRPFIEQLQTAPPNMNQVRFATIAIGDSSYDTFCVAGIHAHNLLQDIGATPITECLKIDVLDHDVPEETAERWLQEHIHLF